MYADIIEEAVAMEEQIRKKMQKSSREIEETAESLLENHYSGRIDSRVQKSTQA